MASRSYINIFRAFFCVKIQLCGEMIKKVALSCQPHNVLDKKGKTRFTALSALAARAETCCHETHVIEGENGRTEERGP